MQVFCPQNVPQGGLGQKPGQVFLRFYLYFAAMLQHRVKHVFDVLPGRVMGIFHVGHTDLIIHQDILFGNPKILLLFKVENLHSPSHWKLCRGKNGKFRMFCIFGSIIVFCKTYDNIYLTCNRQQRPLTQ